MTLKPADMESCDKKRKCLQGVNAGIAYTPGDECEGGYVFDEANCECEILGAMDWHFTYSVYDQTNWQAPNCSLGTSTADKAFTVDWLCDLRPEGGITFNGFIIHSQSNSEDNFGNCGGANLTNCAIIAACSRTSGSCTNPDCPPSDPRYGDLYGWDFYSEGFPGQFLDGSTLVTGGTVASLYAVFDVPVGCSNYSFAGVQDAMTYAVKIGSAATGGTTCCLPDAIFDPTVTPVAATCSSCSKTGTWRFDGTITKTSGGTESVSRTFSVNEGDTFGVISDVETSAHFLPVPNTFIDGNTDITVTRSDVGCTGGGVGFYIRHNYSGGGGINYYLGSGEMFCSAAEGSQCSITGTFIWPGA